MESFVRDVRYGIRTLARTPGFTAVVVLTLALGIGANTAIFSVLNAVVLRPLPFHDPERLVMIWETDPPRGNMQSVASYPSVQDWRSQSRSLKYIATFLPQMHTLTGVERPEPLEGARVSAEFFPMLGVRPALGRTFLPEDDRVGAANVAILSDDLWRRRFGGDPAVVGGTLSLDGIEFTVVGVLPAGFDFPVRIAGAEVWTPTALDESFLPERGLRVVMAAGRLKPGVTLAQGQADMDAVIRSLQEQHPRIYEESGIRLVPLHEQVVGDVRPALLIFLGAVGLVLLIACANVASLLLARGAGRRAEFAVRAAVGAGRLRLVRQLLTESVLISLFGGALGVLVALWGLETLVAVVPAELPRAGQISLDGRVLAFAAAITLLTGLLFGLAPVLGVLRRDLHESFKEAGRAQGVPARHGLRGALVVAEVALALTLLAGAGLLTRSFQRLVNVDPGFDTGNLLTFYMDAGFSKPMNSPQRAALYEEIRERLAALPGVESVVAGTSLPLWGSRIGFGVVIEGRPDPSPSEVQSARYCAVTTGYFRSLGIPLLKGRTFTDRDRLGSPGVMVINEAMARRFFPDEDPLGQRIGAGMILWEDEPRSFEIVGIVGDARESLSSEPQPYMYVPSLQQTWPFMAFALRSTVDPGRLVGAVRAEVASLTREEAAFEFMTMDERSATGVAQQRFAMFLLAAFGAVALILAALGIYGTLSYFVAQRTHEVGVRMALGAQRGSVLRLVLKRGLTLTAIGLLIGLVVSLASARVLSSQLYETDPTDPISFIAVSLLLGIVALLACFLPAHRATRVDPVVALRCE